MFARKELKVAQIPTEVNPADVGTKVLAARRLAMLLFILGMVTESGERVGRTEHEERLVRREAKGQRSHEIGSDAGGDAASRLQP